MSAFSLPYPVSPELCHPSETGGGALVSGALLHINLDIQTLRRSLDAATGIPEVVMMIPAYYRLYMLLRGELTANVAGGPVPTTQKGLAAHYGVCRGTASAALALLNRDGLVKPTRRGRPRSLER
ncbi:hypothetical protein [Niveispirillum sp. KHB5.9]|uniref:hypothetical protein n=1 Tax=Niveispirillum sp. KHB5.9 TaxID=3400269 RepID=UPI003A84CF82